MSRSARKTSAQNANRDSRIALVRPTEPTVVVATIPDEKTVVEVPTDETSIADELEASEGGLLVTSPDDDEQGDDELPTETTESAEIGSLASEPLGSFYVPGIAELVAAASVPASAPATGTEQARASSPAADVPTGLAADTFVVPGPCTKRAGSDAHRSFQCYGTGTTIEEYLSDKRHSSRRKARESLRWDLARGLVRIGERPAEQTATA